MPSKITLTLGTALAGIALCCFVESSFAQDALVASLDATENDDRDAEDKDDKDEKSGRRQTRTTGSLPSQFLTQSGDNMSLGLTSVGETAGGRQVRRYRNMVRHLSGAVSRIAAGGGDENQCRQENLVRKTGRVPRLRR